MATDNKTLDVIAICISVVSLIGSAFSIYLTEYKEANVEITVGQKALLNGKPRVGLLCVFTNTGSRQKVITSASLVWDDKVTFNLEMASSSLEQWKFDDDGKLKIAEPTLYSTLVAPIAVKGRDQSTAILWFYDNTPGSTFKFIAGKHRCSLKILSRSEEVSATQFELEVTDEDVKILDDPQKGATEIVVKTF